MKKQHVIVLGMITVALAITTAVLAIRVSVGARAPQAETVPSCDNTLWSLTEGPYEYISDETLAIFDNIYTGRGAYKGVGQTQYKGLAIICMMGTPRDPLDDSGREAWCVAWKYDAETDTWVAGEPYLWGTMGEYRAWRKEVGLDR